MKNANTMLFPLFLVSTIIVADVSFAIPAQYDSKPFETAFKLFASTLSTDPTNFGALLPLGIILHEREELDQSLDHLSRALIHCPDKLSAKTELGNALLKLADSYEANHETEKAIITLKKVLSIPDFTPRAYSAAFHAIGHIIGAQQEAHDLALDNFRKALQLEPDNVESNFCSSVPLLAMGNLIEGFSQYEYRWLLSDKRKPRPFEYPLARLWKGEPLEGKRILLRWEQGLGDTLLFIRYAQLLKNLHATVIVELQKPLIHLLSLCPYLDAIILSGDPLPEFDYQIPMLNLPLIFKTSLETIPATIPYLYAQDSLVEQWRLRLKQDTNFKVGICWQGEFGRGILIYAHHLF